MKKIKEIINKFLEYEFHLLSFYFNKYKGIGIYILNIEGYITDISLFSVYYEPCYKRLYLSIFFKNFKWYIK